ncbi:patatin-like phospholipase domain-containing protein 7 [Sycon ciliatum]|uniref:patatin-like phospholipase domain-containing protein 7 n=1 Tax=Sycon ciliatum TaxID=27933 RepID=UPI0031F63373
MLGLLDAFLYLVAAVVSCAVLGLFFRGRGTPKRGEESRENATPTEASRGQSRVKQRSQQVLQISRQVWRRMPSAQTWLYGTDIPGRKRVKKRQHFINLAKAILRLKDPNSPPKELKKGPPPSFLEADWAETQSMLPPEVFYMLKSVRVFGHFEKPLFLELCKHLETCFLPAGATLFRVGQLDDSIYVVQSGKLHVVITDPETGQEEVVKEVSAGHSVYSLLSILDCITGHSAKYCNISARSVQNTTVLRLPAKAFEIVFSKYPDSLVRVVQIIMVRLQRVAFLSLSSFFGLGAELIKVNPNLRAHSDLKIYTLDVNKEPSSTAESASEEPRPGDFSFMSNAPTSDPIPVVQKPCRYCLRLGCSGNCSHFEEPATGTDAQLLSDHSSPHSPPSKPSPVTATTSPVDVSSADFKVACAKAGLERPQFFLGSSDDEEGPALYNMSQRFALQELASGAAAAGASAGSAASGGGGDGGSLSNDEYEALDDEDVGAHDIPNSQLMEYGSEDMASLFGLQDTSVLKGRLRLRHLDAGEVIIEADALECDLYFVLTGCLQSRSANDNEKESLYESLPGYFVGTLCVLTGERSLATVSAKCASSVLSISKTHFYSLLRLRPQVVLSIASDLLKEMSPFLRQMDYALDWELVEAGRAVYRQGDVADSLYIVLTGRLRSVVKHKADHKELVGEYGRGDTVGVAEVLTGAEYGTTVHAVRDTEIAVIPRGLLNYIKRQYPQVVSVLIHWLGQRVIGSYRRSGGVSYRKGKGPVQSTNLANIAVIPASKDVPLSNFTTELCRALKYIGPVLRLTSNIVEERLGSAALDTVHEYRLLSWLSQQEDVHRIVLYQTDKIMSMWTQRCIRQADCILIVGLGSEEDPGVGELEAELDKMSVRAQKELVLLHRPNTVAPENTVEWLVNRGWCSAHHHIRCPDSVFEEGIMTEKEREKYAQMASHDRKSDFARLARRLTGTSIALVLGGGGARGCAQPGVMKALEEAGVPFDMVGGTSIGSLMGAVYCEERNADALWSRSREWALDFGVLWRKVVDITWPTMSLLSGKSINNSIKWLLKEKQIEDLWLPYFAVTTDISEQSMKTHHSGSLWRYVRASMTLTGYYPPMCDPVDGHLLVDGGYTNNLPTDVMRALGAETVIAIDVGSKDEKNLTNYGDTLSGWYLLWKKLWPWSPPVKIPDMAEVQSRLAYVSCVRQLEQAKTSEYVVYLRPPIDKYGLLSFLQFDDIATTGLEYGRSVVEEWRRDGTLHSLLPQGQELPRNSTTRHSTTRQLAKRNSTITGWRPKPPSVNNSFTNLAELASRIDPPECSKSTSSMRHSRSASTFFSTSDPGRFGSSRYKQIFPKELLGYSSDVSDEEGALTADDLSTVQHAVRFSRSMHPAASAASGKTHHARRPAANGDYYEEEEGENDEEALSTPGSPTESPPSHHRVAFAASVEEHVLP